MPERIVYEINDIEFHLCLIKQGGGRWAVVYGQERKDNMSPAEAAKHFGLCLFHNLSCAGRLD